MQKCIKSVLSNTSFNLIEFLGIEIKTNNLCDRNATRNNIVLMKT